MCVLTTKNILYDPSAIAKKPFTIRCYFGISPESGYKKYNKHPNLCEDTRLDPNAICTQLKDHRLSEFRRGKRYYTILITAAGLG
eukprot:scaffold4718_cov138-Skeletonema_marinoi.AAC.3